MHSIITLPRGQVESLLPRFLVSSEQISASITILFLSNWKYCMRSPGSNIALTIRLLYIFGRRTLCGASRLVPFLPHNVLNVCAGPSIANVGANLALTFVDSSTNAVEKLQVAKCSCAEIIILGISIVGISGARRHVRPSDSRITTSLLEFVV